MKRCSTILWIIVITATSLFAQPPGGQGGRFQRPMERLESYKKVRMIETLKLDEQTGLKLVSRYSKHLEQVKTLESERSDLVDKLESLVRSNSSDSEFQRSFNELFEIEKKIAGARVHYIEELKEIFSNKQIAEYILFERNYFRDLRNVAKDVQKERSRKN